MELGKLNITELQVGKFYFQNISLIPFPMRVLYGMQWYSN
jgi:hypothetical protein